MFSSTEKNEVTLPLACWLAGCSTRLGADEYIVAEVNGDGGAACTGGYVSGYDTA